MANSRPSGFLFKGDDILTYNEDSIPIRSFSLYSILYEKSLANTLFTLYIWNFELVSL